MTATFKPYPKYKPSGVEWLGDIPDEWEVKNAKRYFVRKKDLNKGMLCNDRLALTLNGVVERSLDDTEGLQAGDFESYQIFEKDDLVFKLIDLQNIKTSRVGLVFKRGIMSPAYIRLTATAVNARYAYWSYTDLYNLHVFNQLGAGVRETLGYEELLQLLFQCPSNGEQTAIANFLDSETAKIDETIKELEKSIELLNEEKTSLINEYVMGKINADKETPRHWQKKQLRHFAEVLRGKFTHRPRNDPAFYGGEFPFIQTGDITGTSKYITGFKQTLNHRGIAVSKEFPKGTLVMAIAANIGDVAILDFPAYFPDSIVGLVPRAGVDLMFLYYLMISMKDIMLGTATVSTQMNLNVDQVSALSAYCPPLKEQTEIAHILDSETQTILSLISEKESLIETLKEYRTSLIHEAVTGKIDLRKV